MLAHDCPFCLTMATALVSITFSFATPLHQSRPAHFLHNRHKGTSPPPSRYTFNDGVPAAAAAHAAAAAAAGTRHAVSPYVSVGDTNTAEMSRSRSIVGHSRVPQSLTHNRIVRLSTRGLTTHNTPGTEHRLRSGDLPNISHLSSLSELDFSTFHNRKTQYETDGIRPISHEQLEQTNLKTSQNSLSLSSSNDGKPTEPELTNQNLNNIGVFLSSQTSDQSLRQQVGTSSSTKPAKTKRSVGFDNKFFDLYTPSSFLQFSKTPQGSAMSHVIPDDTEDHRENKMAGRLLETQALNNIMLQELTRNAYLLAPINMRPEHNSDEGKEDNNSNSNNNNNINDDGNGRGENGYHSSHQTEPGAGQLNGEPDDLRAGTRSVDNPGVLAAIWWPAVSDQVGIEQETYQSPRAKKRDSSTRMMALLRQRNTNRIPLPHRQRGQRLHRIEEEIVRRKHERRPLELYIPAGDQGHTCEPERDGTQPMTCPSASNVCLYDSMICDGSNDCPGGEDETFPLCVLRHWTFRWLRHFHAMFGTPRS